MTGSRERCVDDPSSIAAATTLLVVAVAIWLVMPIFAGAAADSLGLDEGQVGRLASADFAGIALASLFAPFWIRRFNWRIAATIGMACLVIGNAASIYADTFANLVIARFFTDFAGGTVASIGLASLADTMKTDRNFGLAIAAQTVFGSLALLGLPYLIAQWGVDSIFATLIVVTLASFPVVSRLTPHGRAAGVTGSRPGKAILLPFLGLIGMLFFFSNIGAVWTYIERIGAAADLAATYIGKGLAISNVVALGGALAAASIGDRYGHLRPLVLVALLQLLALGLFYFRIDAVTFLVALSIYSFFWNFAIPYQMTATARADPSGRLIVLATAFQGAGAAVGPGLVSLFIQPDSFSAVYFVASAFSVLCLLFFLPLLRAHRV